LRDTDIGGVFSDAEFEEFRHGNRLTAGSFIAKGRPPRVPEDVSCDDVLFGCRSHATILSWMISSRGSAYRGRRLL
jgi:hypothetical protein